MFQLDETDTETKAFIRENLKAFKSFKTEIHNKSKTGKSYWLELYIQPIYNEKGIPEGFMAIEIDITDRIEKEQLIKSYIQEIESKQAEITVINENLEQKVSEKTRDLELSIIQIQKSQDEIVKKEKMATLGVLIAGIAHEVNTPLGAIKASADNLDYLFSTDFTRIINNLSLSDLKHALKMYAQLNLINAPSTIVQRQFAKQILQEINLHFPENENAFVLSKELAALGFENLTEELQLLLQLDSCQEIMKMIKVLLNIQRSLKTINEGAIKSSKIIKALNVYSHGTDQQEQAPFNLKDSMDNIIMLLWNKIKYHASVKNNIPENITLTGYEDELAQVWTNIMNNALQASNNKCAILIDYTDTGNEHIVSIKNDGPKIPEDVIPKIFDEFFTTKKRGEGTGLGLNIVKSIVEKHDGKITCESTELNTIFTIKLPKKMSSKKIAILAVDDERIILDSLRIQIEKSFKQEYLFELAESAEEALEVIDDLVGEGIELLLVISDYQMPGMKGDEFAATVKAKFAHLNIVLLTGQITEEKSVDLLNRNIVLKVLQKPWKEKDLLDVIHSLVANV